MLVILGAMGQWSLERSPMENWPQGRCQTKIDSKTSMDKCKKEQM